MADSKRTYEKIYKVEEPDTTISRNPLTRRMARWFISVQFKKLVFTASLLLMVAGIAGTYMGLKPVFVPYPRSMNKRPLEYPYWTDIICGGLFAYISFDRNWFKKKV